MNDLVFYDLETTGANANTCEIVEMCFADVEGEILLHTLVKPGRIIEKKAYETHGISQADVEGALAFADHAPLVQQIVDEATILVGFNNYRFDSVILDRELKAVGMRGLSGVEEADLFTLWKRHERRTLVDAAKRFANYDLENAHSASADTTILPTVLVGMMKTFQLEGNLVELSQPEGAVDREGKFRQREDGTIVFNFGKYRDQPVQMQRGYLEWMLNQDFSPEVKRFCREFLA